MHVFPTRNIHLVQSLTDGQGKPIAIDLAMYLDWPPNTVPQAWTDLPKLPGAVVSCDIPSGATDPSSIVDTTATGAGMRLTPFPPGFSGIPGFRFMVLSVRVPQPNPAPPKIANTMIRVAVHEDVTRLFLPYGELFLRVGQNDWVLTVFAQFVDNESWDVTEHPWLEFDSDDHGVATIDSSGRITAVAAGQTEVWVRPAGRPAQTQRCKITVQTLAQMKTETLDGKPNPSLVVTRRDRPATATSTLYLLSEGYDDRDRFEKHVVEVKDGLFSEANAPYRWVKHRFAITTIFLRSAGTRGITLGPPIAVTVDGHGKMLQHVDMMTAQRIPVGADLYDPARLGAFGLMYGARLGDVDGSTGVDESSDAAVLSSWLSTTEIRSISVDIRRIGPRRDANGILDPRVAFEQQIRKLFGDLGLPLADGDRIAFLVDDQLRGGARLSIAGLEPSVNRFACITVGADGVPFDGIAHQFPNPLVTRVSQQDFYHRDYVATSLAHELGHTYGLGDEYETHRDRVTADEPTRNDVERYDNLQLLNDVLFVAPANPADPPDPATPTINVTRIKWNVPRAAKVSRVKNVQPLGAGSSLIVQIDGDAARTWKKNDVVRLRSTFAIPRPRNPDGTVDVTAPRLLDFGYVVTDASGDKVWLFSTDVGPTSTDALSVLYAPILTPAGDPTTLIDAAVLTYLDNQGVFPKPPGGCASTHTGAVNEDVMPPNTIPNVKWPTYRADLIGLYEGGNDHACGVVRPAGRCKMRRSALTDEVTLVYKETWEFCFVCKFIIADRIDPEVLPKVQIHYPKDC